jgi:hypothetical protein
MDSQMSCTNDTFASANDNENTWQTSGSQITKATNNNQQSMQITITSNNNENNNGKSSTATDKVLIDKKQPEKNVLVFCFNIRIFKK